MTTTPYLYSVIQHRNPRAAGEMRNMGLLLVTPEDQKAELLHAPLSRIFDGKHLKLESIRSQLADLEASANWAFNPLNDKKVSPKEWFKRQCSFTDNALRLLPPGGGVTASLENEKSRLLMEITGYRKSSAEIGAAHRLVAKILRTKRMRAVFSEGRLQAGDAFWTYDRLHWKGQKEATIMEVVDFRQEAPQKILDEQFARIGRIEFLKNCGYALDPLFVLGGDQTRVELGRKTLEKAHVGEVLIADENAIIASLERRGFGQEEPASMVH